MEEWKEYKLGEVVRLINGRAYSQHELFDDGKYRIVRVGNLSGGDRWFYSNMELSDEKYCEKGDLLYAWACNFGPYIWKGEKTIYHYHIWKLVEDEDVVDKLFLFHYLKYLTPYWLGNVNGSVMVHITKGTMEKFPITLPSLRTQRRIASILSSLDDKIEVNRRINDNLEQQAQALFKSWFVDFEPFRDQPFVESELGMIPEGWRVACLSSIADYINGLAMQKYRPVEDEVGLPVLKIKELGQGSCDDNSEMCSSSLIGDKYVVDDGDIIFSWSGTLMVKIWCGGKCGLNQHLFVVKPNGTPKWFAYLWTKHHLDNFIQIAKDKAVTMGHIKRGELDKAKVLIPDSNELLKMDYMMKPIHQQMISNEVESHRLSELRDTLLPRLMSGELSVDGLKGQFAVSPGRCPGSKEHVSNKTAL